MLYINSSAIEGERIDCWGHDDVSESIFSSEVMPFGRQSAAAFITPLLDGYLSALATGTNLSSPELVGVQQR